MRAAERMLASPDQNLRKLFQLKRKLQEKDVPLTSLIEQLMDELKSFVFSSMKSWDGELLRQARYFAESVIPLYVSLFYDPSQIPVTYYKREKWIRRHLDKQFSILFHEIEFRSNGTSSAELIIDEPIYYLLQKAREKSFPKASKSQNKRPHLPTLKIRFHVDLAGKLDSPESEGSNRRILLPFEI